MRLRAHRRNLVIWSSSTRPASRSGALRLMPAARGRRIRWFIRISALLAIMGLMDVTRGTHPRRHLMLGGAVLTVAGIAVRSSPVGVILLPGLMFLLSAPLVPDIPEADRKRRVALSRELAAYSTPAQRRDLEATLDQYPDNLTHELRDILAGQAMVHCSSAIPGSTGSSACGVDRPRGCR